MVDQQGKVINLKLDDIPAMPFVVSELMSLIADPNASIQKVCDLISADAAITSKILQVSNSPFFGCSREVTSLRNAVVIMGFNTIKSIVITFSTRKVFKRKGLMEQLLWEHSVGAALAANLIAKHNKKVPPEEAFIGGLLHDIGKDIMNHCDNAKYEEVMKQVYNEGVDFIETENDIFGFSHLDAGVIAIKKWKLPKSIEYAIKYHHDTSLVEDLSTTEKNYISIIALANLFCIKKGIGRREGEESLDLAETIPAKDLGLDKEIIDKLLITFEQSYEEEKGMFI